MQRKVGGVKGIAHFIWLQLTAKLNMQDGMIEQVQPCSSRTVASASHDTLATACICLALAVYVTIPTAIWTKLYVVLHCVITATTCYRCVQLVAPFQGQSVKTSYIVGCCVLSSIGLYAARRGAASEDASWSCRGFIGQIAMRAEQHKRLTSLAQLRYCTLIAFSKAIQHSRCVNRFIERHILL